VKRPVVLGLFALVGVVLVVVFDQPRLRALVAVGACYLLLRVGLLVVGSFARPVPAPPPPGELRRVRLLFRCSLCGTEVRMTSANDEVPEPPRHCMEDMELVAPAIE
jgi:hypothetical protein